MEHVAKLALLHLKLGPDRPDVLGSQRGLRADQLPLFHGFGAGFPAFSMVHCACSSALFAEHISMRRLQPAAPGSLLSGRSGLHRQPYRRQQVGV